MEGRQLWVDRDLRIAVLARGMSAFGDGGALVALTLRIEAQGGRAAEVAALLIAGMLPVAVMAPMAGRIVDGVDNRKVLLIANTLQATVCVPLVFINGPLIVILLVATLGVGQAVCNPTWQAIIPRIVEERRLGSAMAISQTGVTLAGVAAPAVGAVLSAKLSTGVPLAVDSLTFAAAAAGALLIRVSSAPSGKAVVDSRQGGLSLLRSDPVSAPLLIQLAVFALLGLMISVVEVFLVRRTLGASGIWYGAIAAIWAGGSVAGVVVAGRAATNAVRGRAAVVATVVMSMAFVIFAVAPGVIWLIPASIMGGVANGAVNVCVITVVTTRSPEGSRGRIAASMSGVLNIASVISLAVGGVVGSVLSPRQVFLMAGLLGMSATVITGPRVVRALRLE